MPGLKPRLHIFSWCWCLRRHSSHAHWMHTHCRLSPLEIVLQWGLGMMHLAAYSITNPSLSSEKIIFKRSSQELGKESHLHFIRERQESSPHKPQTPSWKYASSQFRAEIGPVTPRSLLFQEHMWSGVRDCLLHSFPVVTAAWGFCPLSVPTWGKMIFESKTDGFYQEEKIACHHFDRKRQSM